MRVDVRNFTSNNLTNCCTKAHPQSNKRTLFPQIKIKKQASSYSPLTKHIKPLKY